MGETSGSAFWGVDQDADAFARAIMRYTTKFSRWSSPKYIIGESYGTLRTGAVAFQFLHAGQFLIAGDAATEDRLMELALEAGADDVITSPQGFELRCDLHLFDKVSHALEAAGIRTESAELSYIPLNLVPVTDAATAQALAKLHEALDDLDDVQNVFSNEETPDDPHTAGQG
jgi:transcriptional/translational regulatory protein YebC/TACO1